MSASRRAGQFRQFMKRSTAKLRRRRAKADLAAGRETQRDKDFRGYSW